VAGLSVYAFDGSTYTGYNGTTDSSGNVNFTLPQGDYRFRVDRNGTQFWSGGSNHCALPGCTGASVTVTIPVTVSVLSGQEQPYAGLNVYAFDGAAYTGVHGVTDTSGQVVFTLPTGTYRFRTDLNGVQFWSSAQEPCTIPGCIAQAITLPGGGTDLSATIDYTYDPLYRLTSADYSTDISYHYTYDPVGNRLEQETSIGGLPSIVSYTYDDANRMTAAGSTPMSIRTQPGWCISGRGITALCQGDSFPEIHGRGITTGRCRSIDGHTDMAIL
jgi:YD repeat-containing protein